MHTYFQGLRNAISVFRKAPSFAAMATLILALGMGVSLTIFAFVDAALIKPLPYSNPSGLVGVFGSFQSLSQANLSYPDYLDFKNQNQVFSSLAAYQHRDLGLSAPDGTQLVGCVRVSDDFFRTLGVKPILGRDFYAGEDLPTASPTVILSYETWQKRYGGRDDALGRTVNLDDRVNTVIGVLPQDFRFATAEPAEFWMPIQPATTGCDSRRGCHSYYAVGRFKDGLSLQAAASDMSSIAQRLERQYPDSNRGQGTTVIGLTDVMVGNIRPLLLLLLGGACLLLLIAAVNLTSLLLVRSDNRKQEIAVRCALGASRTRLIQQFVIEGLAIVGLGCAIALACVELLIHLLIRLIPAEVLARVSFLNSAGLNLHVLAVAGLICLLAIILFSLTPVGRLSLTEIRQGLVEGSRGSTGGSWRRLGSKLVVLELATAMVLLVSAGLIAQSLYRLRRVNIGFQPDHLATLNVVAHTPRYHSADQLIGFERQLVENISHIPGVTSVGFARLLPVGSNSHTSWYRVIGRPYHGEHDETPDREVSAGYLRTLGARLLRGRYFTDVEDATKPAVVVVNEAMAKKYFPGDDPIGKQISYVSDPPVPMEIVGVVEDITEGPLDVATPPVVYLPFNQHPKSDFSIVVRTSQPENSLFSSLTRSIHQIDPLVTTSGGISMSEIINDSPAAYPRHLASWLMSGFALTALLLGGLGLYGVIAYSVSRRTREIGIRIALGAQVRDVRRLVIRQGLIMIGMGIGLGFIGALAATRLMTSQLFGISPSDPITIAAAAGLLVFVALLACYVPALRATRVDPLIALRSE